MQRPDHRLLIALLAATAASGGAHAGAGLPPVMQEYTVNAAGACVAALPQYATVLRARPTALVNEGTGRVFVTCSLASNNRTYYGQGDPAGDEPYVVQLRAGNEGAGGASVTCTLVDGDWLDRTYYPPELLSMPTPGATDGRSWYPVDNESSGAPFRMPNLSCVLDPGAALYQLRVLVLPAGPVDFEP